MKYVKHSIIYKIFAGSWLFGWLISTPEDRSHYYQSSLIYNLTRKLLEIVVGLIYSWGKVFRKYEPTSLVAINPAGFVGLLLFFYFGFDLVLHDYDFYRTIIEIWLVIAAVLMVFSKILPGIWQGSLIYRIPEWWSSRD